MAYFMFVDESGQDQQESPYEVLAGVVIHDAKLWPLVKALHQAEKNHFGRRYASVERELKAKRLLKTKVFRHAASRDPFSQETRLRLASECLASGSGKTPDHYAALGQAKIAYCEDVLKLARRYGCLVFASIVPKTAPRPAGGLLRKDYSYLFERFYFLLSETEERERGIVVFDELDHSQSHLLIDQMERYFMETGTGRQRQSRIIPEPFFVHSHLTTGVHLADLVAYVISWGVREVGMTAPARADLKTIASLTSRLRHNMVVGTRTIWAFNIISDLRPRSERGVPVVGGGVPRPPRRRRTA